MAVIEYSLRTQGDLYVGPHFKAREFKCADGSDIILIDTALVEALEEIRSEFGKPIVIRSGYRTKTYNAKVGGAEKSQHLYGIAADISINGVSELEVCRAAEAVLLKMGLGGGVGHYPGRFSHVDTRKSRARWQQVHSGGPQYNVAGFGSDTVSRRTLRLGDRGTDVAEVQRYLGITPDGIYGPKTEYSVKAFQRAHALSADGIVGMATYAVLFPGS